MPEFDLDRALRRLKPSKRIAARRRLDAQLAFAEDQQPIGPPLILDTCVYIHALKAKTPPAVDILLRARTIFHSSVAIAELAYRFGARIPANKRERAAFHELAGTIRGLPDHWIAVPSATTWGEAGIVAGARARVGGFPAEQPRLNDALLFIQAVRMGAGVLTANIVDYDILQQLVPTGLVIFYREET